MRSFAVIGVLACAMFAAGGCVRGGHGDFRDIIENAKQRVYPAIVYVKPIREDFSQGERTKEEVFGSGAIVSPDGLFFTNAHVAEKATEIRCVLNDREQYPATLVGLDKETDLALLKITLPADHPPLPVVEFGDSDLVEEGQFVMAMGSPFGFTRSISFGVISNTRRYIGFTTQYKYNLWLQTDAAINPGNSGGPLVDSEGRVVGVNTLSVFFADGLGFAIPSNIAREVLDTLRRDGRVRRTMVGIELQALKDFDRNTFFDAPGGVLVAEVEDPSPAKDVGIEEGDLLMAIDGVPVDATYVEELPGVRRILSALEPETPARFTIRRNGAERTIDVIPVDKGEFVGRDLECERWNMTVKGISRYATPELSFFRKKGVYVQGVKYPGNAANARLSPNDIIVSIDGKEIEGVDDFERIYGEVIADETREKKALLVIMRAHYTKQVVLDYRKSYTDEKEKP